MAVALVMEEFEDERSSRLRELMDAAPQPPSFDSVRVSSMEVLFSRVVHKLRRVLRGLVSR